MTLGGRSTLDVLDVLLAHCRWFAAGTLIGEAAAAVVMAFMTPIYRVDFSVVVLANTLDETAAVARHLERAVGTWAFVLSDRDTFAQGAARMHKDDATLDTLDAGSVIVSVRPIDNSTVVAVAVRADEPRLAAAFATALYEVAEASVLGQRFPIARLGSIEAPSTPESPRVGRSLMLGGLAGFLAAMAVAFLAAAARPEDRRVSTGAS